MDWSSCSHEFPTMMHGVDSPQGMAHAFPTRMHGIDSDSPQGMTHAFPIRMNSVDSTQGMALAQAFPTRNSTRIPHKDARFNFPHELVMTVQKRTPGRLRRPDSCRTHSNNSLVVTFIRWLHETQLIWVFDTSLA